MKAKRGSLKSGMGQLSQKSQLSLSQLPRTRKSLAAVGDSISTIATRWRCRHRHPRAMPKFSPAIQMHWPLKRLMRSPGRRQHRSPPTRKPPSSAGSQRSAKPTRRSLSTCSPRAGTTRERGPTTLAGRRMWQQMILTTGGAAASAANCGRVCASLPSRAVWYRRHAVTGRRRRKWCSAARGMRHERVDTRKAAALARVSRTVLGCSSAMARAWLSASSPTLPRVPRRPDRPGLWREDQGRNTLQDHGAVLWWTLQVARRLLDRSKD